MRTIKACHKQLTTTSMSFEVNDHCWSFGIFGIDTTLKTSVDAGISTLNWGPKRRVLIFRHQHCWSSGMPWLSRQSGHLHCRKRCEANSSWPASWVRNMRPGQKVACKTPRTNVHNQLASAETLLDKTAKIPICIVLHEYTVFCISSQLSYAATRWEHDNDIINRTCAWNGASISITPYFPTQAVTSTTPVVPRHVFSIIMSYMTGFVSIVSGVSPSLTSIPKLWTLTLLK